MRLFDGAVFFGWVIGFLVGIPLQKYAQSLVALLLRDSTPRKDGRLTLNPSAHHQPLPVLFAVLISLGTSLVTWGKPIELNPFYIRFRKGGMFIVAITAPLANLLIAFLIWLATKGYIVNAKPGDFLAGLLVSLVTFNIYLAVFNLIPVPPLGGWDILKAILPNEWNAKIQGFEEYGILTIVILVFILPFFTGGQINPLFQFVINPLMQGSFQLITGFSFVQFVVTLGRIPII